jgi:hypothetical protein
LGQSTIACAWARLTCWGCQLYVLYAEVAQRIGAAPWDSVTGAAQATNCAAGLLRNEVKYERVPVVCTLGDQAPVTVTALSTDSMSQLREKLANALNLLPHHDATAAVYDAGNDRLQDVDARSQLDRQGWCRVNTVAQLRVGASGPVRLEVGARPLSDRTLPPGRRLYHLDRRSSSADAPTEAQFLGLMRFRDAVQPAMDAWLQAALAVDDDAPPPPPIKFLLDFLDAQAAQHAVANPRIVQRWKHNALVHLLLVPLLERPQRLLNIRVSLAEQNRCVL